MTVSGYEILGLGLREKVYHPGPYSLRKTCQGYP